MLLEQEITAFIDRGVAQAERPELMRQPLVAFSAADDPGYGQLKTLVGPWHLLPEDLLPGCRSVISFFIPFAQEVSRDCAAAQNVSPLWGQAYLEVNSLIDRLGPALASWLERQGYQAHAVSATHNYDPKTLRAAWSHRSAAALAGLGSWGDNRLLLTAKGSAGRLGSVLTTARLSPGQQAPEQCLHCSSCRGACPLGLLQEVGDGFDKAACNSRLQANSAWLLEQGHDQGLFDVCGKCVGACPLAYVQ